MQIYLISYLVSIIFWLWIIRKYDKFEREPLRVILFLFLVGGLISAIPAGILNSLFLILNNYYADIGLSEYFVAEKSRLFYGFVGINEELLKAVATIILVRKMKDFSEPADALVYAMTVAFGFAVMENISYTIRYGLTVFLIRQFNAVPLHIGLAAIWGIGIAKARFLHNGKYLLVVAPYVLIAASLHALYNISTTLVHGSLVTFIILAVCAFFLIRFATRKIKRYAEDAPFSNRLFCHSCNTINFPFERCCKKCGQKFDLEFYVLCPGCNVKVIQNAPSCPKCGVEIGSEVPVKKSDFGWVGIKSWYKEMILKFTGMKMSKKIMLLFISIMVFLTIYTLIQLIPSDSGHNQYKNTEWNQGDHSGSDDHHKLFPEDSEPWVEYLQDSTYKTVIDTVITVYKIHTGEKISSLPMPAWPIKSLDIHPSGSHLVVMGDDSLHVYDLIKDNLANTGTTSLLDGDSTTVRPYDDAWVDLEGQDEIHFSSDGRYVMTIYYRESEVSIYRWPDLEYLTTEYMGLGRNKFWWESREGKLVFFYHENQCIYRTEFPSDTIDNVLFFSEPAFVDSVRREE